MCKSYSASRNDVAIIILCMNIFKGRRKGVYMYLTRSHVTRTIAVADVYVNSVKRYLQTTQPFIFILLR